MIKIGTDASGRITVTFPYSPDIVAKVRTIQTRRWHPEGKYWSFQRSATVYREIASALAGQELEIDPAPRGLIPETEADSQSHQAASASSATTMAPLFDRIRQLIRLKHYSPRTEDTYLHWITKYLMESLRLRVKDVDFGNNHLLVRDAKGMKDRITVLPDNLKAALRHG